MQEGDRKCSHFGPRSDPSSSPGSPLRCHVYACNCVRSYCRCNVERVIIALSVEIARRLTQFRPRLLVGYIIECRSWRLFRGNLCAKQNLFGCLKFSCFTPVISFINRNFPPEISSENFLRCSFSLIILLYH